jgi:hypothetical protein
MSEKPKQTIKTEKVGIRKAPKYLQFILLGGFIGIGTALILGLGSGELQGPLVAIGATVGVGLGILVAVILDRIFLSRGKVLDATKITE